MAQSLEVDGSRPEFQGLNLADALTKLENLGLRILFTSQVVQPRMEVSEEPIGQDLVEILQELLEPHDLRARLSGNTWVVVPTFVGIQGRILETGSERPLEGVRIIILGSERETRSQADGTFILGHLASGTYSLEARRPGFVIERQDSVKVAPGRITPISFSLSPVDTPLNEIIVTPSLIGLLQSNPTAAMTFDRDEIESLPHLGDDLFRALGLLPGTSGDELTAEVRIRGSRADEVMVMLDQLELFEPFHFKDHGNALSIIAPKAISEVELILGSFPARYGDRMGGILDMRTADPSEYRERNLLGLSILSAQAAHCGLLPEDKGGYLAVARYGSLDLVSALVPQEEKPSYWDFFGKLDFQNSVASRWGFRLLHAADRLDFFLQEEGDEERVETRYQNSYFWLTHRGLMGNSVFVDSVVSIGRVDRDRRVVEKEPEGEGFNIRDERILKVFGLKQEWNFSPQAENWSDRHYLRWGFDWRRFETDYDYFNERQLEDPLDEIHTLPSEGSTEFKKIIHGQTYSLYVTDRWRWNPQLTVELGIRYDEQTLSEDQNFSPRANLVWVAHEKSIFRAAWGYFYQSQRPYELGVEDGETSFFPAERTEQSALGWETHFGKDLVLHLDAYYREITSPRPHYVNLYEPISSFPEIEPDRRRIVPDRSHSKGIEVFLRRSGAPKLDWWISYTYSRIEDRVEGNWQPRSIDQPHTFVADLNYRINRHWTLNLAFQYHTGWPSTEITAQLLEDDEGEIEPVPVFGPIYGERLDDYHRLDLRASREWSLEKGSVSFFIELQNLYNRENHAGFNVEFEYDVRDDGRVTPLLEKETWAGFVPSFGFNWRF